jgi:Fe-S-cluster containining protein
MEGTTYIDIDEIFALGEKLQCSTKTLLENYINFGEKIVRINKKEIKFKFFMIKQQKGACIFLQGHECKIYSARPFQCQQFPFWFELFNNKKLYREIQKTCQGFGKGRKYNAAEIELRLTQDNQYRLKLYKNSDFLGSFGLEKLISDVRNQIEKEGFSIESEALESLKIELLLDVLNYYSQTFLKREVL